MTWKTELINAFPYGWQKAYDKLLIEDIQKILNKWKIKSDEIHFHHLRTPTFEKTCWLGLISQYFLNRDIEQVIQKYLTLSKNICPKCGKPDTPSYCLCFNCFQDKTAKGLYEWKQIIPIEPQSLTSHYYYNNQKYICTKTALRIKQNWYNINKTQKEL